MNYKLGEILFRVRAIIGLFSFIVVYIFAKPTIPSFLQGLTLLIIGLALRFWTAGYIGSDARSGKISAQNIVTGGPYRYFRHPLYLGNFAIVAGMLIALKPPLTIALLIMLGFILIYGLIARSETQFLEQSDLEIVAARFSLQRAKSEWHTWLVTALALLLTIAKALFLAQR